MNMLFRKYFYLCLCILLRPAIPAFCQLPPRPPITGIAFVALQVSDLNKANTFYDALLGYKSSPAAAASAGGVQRIAINARQSIFIQPGLPPGTDERLLAIAFETTDVEAMRLYLKANGIVVPEKPGKEMPGMLSFTIADPDGHPVKFVQQLAGAKESLRTTLQVNAVSRRILHAGLTIANASTANNFYATILGFSEIWRGGANDSLTSWINMRVPEGTDYLEYMLVNGPVNRQQLGSLHHIALMVPDMQQAVDMLRIRSQTNGYPLSAPRIGRNNRWQLNLFDPDGTRIELMEPFPMR